MDAAATAAGVGAATPTRRGPYGSRCRLRRFVRVAGEGQFAAGTAGRVADPVSWLQAVRWAIDVRVPGLSEKSTMRIARVLARLSECRPGLEYLERVSGVPRSTLCRQLGALRAAGLLVYVAQGGVRDGVRTATVFERVIPPAYDRALGIRTLGEGPRRRMVGISASGRRIIARLARRTAAGKARRHRITARRRPVAPAARRNGGTLGVFTTGHVLAAEISGSPQEGLAGGNTGGSSAIRTNTRPRPAHRPNRCQRRFALARDLLTNLPWLGGRAALPRIAWVTRDLADAGWTCDDVQAWIHLTQGDVPARIKRPSGLLARRTASAHRIWTTPEQRAEMVEAWRDSRTAAAARHHEWDQDLDTAPAGPPPAAAALIAQALAPTDTPHDDDQDQGEVLPLRPDGLPDPAAMTPAQLARVRAEVVADPHDLDLGAVRALAESEYAGPAYARALYGHDLVDRAYRLAPSRTLRLTGAGAR